MAPKRRRYTEQERARVLAAAKREGLTGKQASKKFGVSEVTLWKWRRAAKGAKMKRHSRAARTKPATKGSLASMIRAEVHARVRDLLPEIVRAEIAQAFGAKRRM